MKINQKVYKECLINKKDKQIGFLYLTESMGHFFYHWRVIYTICFVCFLIGINTVYSYVIKNVT